MVKLIAHCLDKSSGGMERSISKFDMEIGKYLDTELLLFKDKVSLPHRSPVKFLKSLRIPTYLIDNKKRLKILVSLLGFFNFLYRTLQIRKSVSPDDLCIAFDDYFGAIVILSGRKVIVSVHNSPDFRYSSGELVHLLPDWFYREIIIKRLYRKAQKIHVVSEGIKKELVEQYQLPPEKIVVIYNFFDFDIIKEQAEKIEKFYEGDYIINVGHLNKQKNQELLIKIFANLKKKGFKEKLIIIGDGEKRENLLKLTKKYNLEEEVFLLGKKENPYPYMKDAKAFVLTSLYEGFPSVLVEAAILQVPICALKVPHGVDEIVYEPSNTPEELEKDISKVLTDESYKMLKVNFQNKILKEKFNNDRNIKKWLEVINECLSDR